VKKSNGFVQNCAMISLKRESVSRHSCWLRRQVDKREQ